MGDEVNLPADDTDLENDYSVQDYLDVDLNDEIRVCQTATQQYMIHQFKDFVGTAPQLHLKWIGRSTLAPSVSIVKLEIYNQVTTTWVEVDSDNATAEDTDFTLEGDVTVDVDNYKDATNIISCRVWQQAL